jgi:hypothetical protein
MRKCKLDKLIKEKPANIKQKPKKKKKKNALIVCRDGNEYWTTQDQFWQWVRERVVVKMGDAPLQGKFVRETSQFDVVLGNQVLNLTHRHHLREVLHTRRYQASRA